MIRSAAPAVSPSAFRFFAGVHPLIHRTAKTAAGRRSIVGRTSVPAPRTIPAAMLLFHESVSPAHIRRYRSRSVVNTVSVMMIET